MMATLKDWLIRAVCTLARDQDDEREVFIRDFDRSFPNGIGGEYDIADRYKRTLDKVTEALKDIAEHSSSTRIRRVAKQAIISIEQADKGAEE